MMRFLTVVALVCLVACTSREDKEMAALKHLDVFMDKKPVLDSIPDSMGRKLHDFAVAFPANPKSEKYLYTSTLLAERNSRYFDAAKWSEDYVKNYPNGKFVKGALLAAAFNFEKSGTFDKAITYYEQIAQKYPGTSEGKDAARNAKYLRLGLVTPEQQLEYAIKHADSGTKD